MRDELNIPSNVHTYAKRLLRFCARIHKRNGRYIAEDENSEIRSSAFSRERGSFVIEVLSWAEPERNITDANIECHLFAK